MGKLKDIPKGLQNFVAEVQVELKKCAWPTRPELFESTVMVIVTSVILGFFVGFSDLGLMKVLDLTVDFVQAMLRR